MAWTVFHDIWAVVSDPFGQNLNVQPKSEKKSEKYETPAGTSYDWLTKSPKEKIFSAKTKTKTEKFWNSASKISPVAKKIQETQKAVASVQYDTTAKNDMMGIVVIAFGFLFILKLIFRR